MKRKMKPADTDPTDSTSAKWQCHKCKTFFPGYTEAYELSVVKGPVDGYRRTSLIHSLYCGACWDEFAVKSYLVHILSG